MNVQKWVKFLFIVAGVYDGVLGILFLTAPIQLFNAANVTPPNHIGYVQFPGMLLIVFAIMFFKIAKNPMANRDLILYGILLKFSYCSVVFSHWFLDSIPSIWVLFAFLDLGFLIAFVVTHKALKQTA